MFRSRRFAGLALLGIAALFMGLGLGNAVALAQPLGQANSSQMLTIPAGQTASLNVRGFCLDFGKPFPGSSQAPASLAQDNIRAALNYASNKGYTQSDPAQVQEAIWFLASGQWHRDDHTLGTEIANAASDPANAPAAVSGTSLIDAVKSQGLTATISFAQPAGTPTPDASYGDGVLKITNTGSQDVSIYLPFGSVFPPTTAGDQNLVGFAVGVAQAAPTGTTEATSTVAATTTAAPTETIAATDTAAPTVVATDTAAPTVAATDTAAPTLAPTETVAPTETAAPTETPAPVATSTPAIPNLPKTGGSAGRSPLVFVLFGAGLLALLGGLALLRRPASAR